MTKQELQEIFESSFNWNNWRKVMDFVFPEFKYALTQEEVPLDNAQKQNYAKYIKQHGSTELTDGENLVLYEVALKEKVRLDRNVKSVRKLISGEVFKGYRIGLGVFHNEDKSKWRFTLVIREFSTAFKISDKKPESYTYVFGEGERGRTAAERFYDLSKKADKKLKDLEDAFSVEALSKKFFTQYKEVYQQFVDNIQENPSRLNLFKGGTKEELQKLARDFVKKMMGRIVFLYFLQKKGWMGCKTKWQEGEDLFMQKLFEASPKDSSFYITFLEPLFFDTLNAKREDSEENCVINGVNFGKVPFLNGGLFEREDNHPENLTLDWEIFNRFFEILNNYNFTIIEDDPDFKEIAVDPEMLGHIFENLLEDNKDKGAFYTPKEIVQYMCQESLIEYLTTQLSKNITDEKLKEAIRNFVIRQDFVALNDINQRADQYVLKALRDIKVCDPAIGSGAFPMGILHEIYRMVEYLQEDRDIFLDIWEKEAWDAARVKEDIIQNSIYGVDIEKGAVDIARLRFWLSIIIDEEEPKPLPNLDYKIVVGNSLLNKFEDHVIDIEWNEKGGSQTSTKTQEFLGRRSELLQEISEKQKLYFDTESSNRTNLSQEVKDLKIDILINQLEMKIASEGTDNEPKIENFTKNAAFVKAQKMYFQSLEWKSVINDLEGIKGTDKPFDHFDWNLDFPEVLNPILNRGRAGFDIVIANPPYLGNKEIGAINQNVFQTQFGYKDDMYVYFFDRSKQLLLPNATLCFITSNTFKFLSTKRHLRLKLIELRIREFYEVGYVFEDAYVNTVITILKNESLKDYEIEFKETYGLINDYSSFMGKVELFNESWNNVFFTPSPLNIELNKRIAIPAKRQYEEVSEWIKTTSSFKNYKQQIVDYCANLDETDICLLGLTCEGGQGLVTGNNSKYLAKIVGSEMDGHELTQELISKIEIVDNSKKQDQLTKMSLDSIYNIAEKLKAIKGNPILFGKFFLYKYSLVSEVRGFDDLGVDEKENGTKENVWIKYYRGNEEGRRWSCPVMESINWSNNSVIELKEGKKTNSRWQGSEFYDSNGFGWVDYFTDRLKAFYVPSSPYSKNIVKFCSISDISNEYILAFLNSSFCSYYVKNFITNTHTLQINDGKVIPIKIPSKGIEKAIMERVTKILELQKSNSEYLQLEQEIDVFFFKIYGFRFLDVQILRNDFWLSEEEYNNLSLEDMEV